MKYVMFTNIKTGIRLPLVGPETMIAHCQFGLGDEWVATSAGFVYLEEVDGLCDVSGESESLNLKPKEEGDETILSAMFAGLDSTLIIVQSDLKKNKAEAEKAIASVKVVNRNIDETNENSRG